LLFYKQFLQPVRKIGFLCITLFALLTYNKAIAQDFSNKGKDFWVIYTGHIDGTTSRMALYITSDQNATGTVSVAGNTIPFTVTANQVTTVRFTSTSTPSNAVAYNGQVTGIGTNKGIHIIADHPVVVYSHILNSARSGSTLVLPTNVLGREYYVSTYKSVSGSGGNIRRSEFALVASQDNTTVEITPAAADANNTYAANTPFQVTLNTGDVFQYQSANDVDLTGTYIKSIATATSPCKPIAIFAGSTWTALGCTNASSGDNLYQQLFPFVSWGKEYITAPFILRSNDVFRILVRDPTTIVQVNGVPLSTATLINNTYYEFNTIGNNTSRIITSDKPICVVQYMITSNCDGVNADPEMIILNSVEQTLKDITVLSARSDLTPPATNITRHFLNIVVKTSALGSLRIDGASYTSIPIAIATTQYSYLQEEVTTSTNTNPSHRITCDSGFLAIAYGYGSVESYGYNAGTNVRDLYQFVSVQNQYATVNFPAACKSSPFYFSMTFPYQPAQITWDFGGLFTNVTINSPVYDSTWFANGKQLYLYRLPTPYTINTVGTYPIKVFAQNPTPDGCSGEQEIDYDLQVFNPPVADFNFTNNGCVTQSVSFLDNSNIGGRPVISRYWNFGDATTGNSNNPSHGYAAAGSYTVQYSLITDIGCLSDTISHVVNLSNPPTALFNASSPKCQNRIITFSDQSTVSTGSALFKWYWDFGDGSSPVVALTNTDQVHTYLNTGTFNVTLKVETTTGCQSIVYTFPVIISPNPVPNFSFPNICLPIGAAQFNNTSTISDGTQALFSYNWNFGDGSSNVNTQNPLHNFTGVGPYSVTLTVTSNNGCIDSVIRSVNTIYAQPQSNFTSSTELCLGTIANFVDQSLATGSLIQAWFWDFGDGSPMEYAPSVSHSYATAGTYIIKHWVVTFAGCYSDTLSGQIVINPLPTVNFNIAGPYCVTRNITFSDASVANAGSIISWQWNLGDATILNLANNNPFDHQYATIGIYPVTLQVTTDKGCVNTIFGEVNIKPLPVPDFTHTRICLPDGISNFTNTSTVSNGASLSYQWNFGDPVSGGNNSSASANPSHYFSTVGPYTITLSALSSDGCTKDSAKIVTDIYAQADAEFTVNPENCLNDVTHFINNSNPLPGNTIVQWNWNFGDGSPISNDQNPFHGFLAAGTYNVKHWIVTDKGCNSDTAIHTVTINPLPTADFSFTIPSCETRGINFTDLSVPNAGTLVGWSWNFHDGSPLEGTQNPTHTFVSNGTYNVVLVLTTDKGCIGGGVKPVVINSRPHPGFISPEVCLTDAFAQFIDTSHITSGSINTWLWNFGDPGSGGLNVSILQNPQHPYAAIGNYTATLIVTSNNGCRDTLIQSFTVNGDIPIANFNALSPASLCANDSVSIQDASTVNFGNITKVEIYWDNTGTPTVFQTDDLPFPGKIYRHLYPNFQSPLTKTFTIRYRSYSGTTCVNDKLKTIVVNAAPRVQFNTIPDICPDALPYQIIQASEIGGVPGSGVFSGPGITAGGVFAPSSVGPGTYTIKFTYTSTAGGCVDTISKTIKVLEPPVANFGFVSPLCEKQAILFNDNSNTVAGILTTWTWDFADGTPIVVRNTGTSFTHTFAAYGTYAVKLKVTTSNGCVSIQKVINVTVNPLPKPNFSLPASSCLPNATVTFNNLSSIADGTQSSFSYLWNFGDPGSGGVNTSTGNNPSHTYVSTGPFSINLQVTSGAGCIHDTSIILNTIHPQPLASFTTDKPEVCIGGSFIFTDNSNSLDGTTTQWNWSMDDGSSKNTPTFTYTYTTAGTYNVSLFVFNSHGCRSTTYTKPMAVHPYPVVDAGPDRFVLEGGTITLEPVVTGNDLSYVWTPNLYFAGSNAVKNPVIKGVDDQTYLLTVTARGGCKVTDNVFIKVLKNPVIPNVFTPNGDGYNDKWVIKYLETYPGCVVEIYNRYGQILFRSVGYNTPWDGNYKGGPVPAGTYYYIIDPKNGRKPVAGFVDILR
jgi:gliding motility-associated-like protein